MGKGKKEGGRTHSFIHSFLSTSLGLAGRVPPTGPVRRHADPLRWSSPLQPLASLQVAARNSQPEAANRQWDQHGLILNLEGGKKGLELGEEGVSFELDGQTWVSGGPAFWVELSHYLLSEIIFSQRILSNSGKMWCFETWTQILTLSPTDCGPLSRLPNLPAHEFPYLYTVSPLLGKLALHSNSQFSAWGREHCKQRLPSYLASSPSSAK